MRIKPMMRRTAYRVLRTSGYLELKRRRRVRRRDGWATILVFHGVSPAVPEDGVTITPTRFRSILHLLRRRYDVLPLGTLVDRLERGVPFTGREAVITFDDGYLDNYEYAVPLLREFELPACFFLTAGYVGTSKRFAWDREKGADNPLMSWGQAREIAELGFEIGCHTWSHPDLGVEPIASRRRELEDARARIEDAVGARVEHFAYPFGGRTNIRPAWIEAIREAGFRSNSSADNGHVTSETDPFLIPRLGASPQRSIAELRIDMDAAW